MTNSEASALQATGVRYLTRRKPLRSSFVIALADLVASEHDHHFPKSVQDAASGSGACDTVEIGVRTEQVVRQHRGVGDVTGHFVVNDQP